jgi:hypothetical protein
MAQKWSGCFVAVKFSSQQLNFLYATTIIQASSTLFLLYNESKEVQLDKGKGKICSAH